MKPEFCKSRCEFVKVGGEFAKSPPAFAISPANLPNRSWLLQIEREFCKFQNKFAIAV